MLALTFTNKAVNEMKKRILDGLYNLAYHPKSNKINKIKLNLIDNLGLNGDLLESEAFGYLAIRSIKKLPLSLKTTTGVKEPVTGGTLYKAN